MRIIYSFFLCLLCLAMRLSAQGLVNVRHYSTEDGLSQNVVQSIIQDHEGYIWFSTWNGLEKFDGYTFTNYKSYPTDSVRLPYNRLVQLENGDKGQIWCLDYNGRVYLFNTRSETFENLCAYHPQVKPCEQTRQLYALPGGIAWAVSYDGELWRFDGRHPRAENGLCHYLPGSCPAHGNRVYTIQADPYGNEWILTDKGCFVHGKELSHEMTTRHMAVAGKKVFLISGHMLMVYTPDEGLHEMLIPNRQGSPYGLFTLQDGRLCIATTRGIIVYRPEDEGWEYCYLSDEQPNIRPATFFQASDGTLWMFDNEQRIATCHLSTKQWEFIDLPESGSQRNYAFIHEDDNGQIWILPPYGELYCYHPQQKRFIQAYTLQNGKQNRYYLTYQSGTRKYLLDTHKNLWFCRDTGFDKISFLHSNSGYLSDNHNSEARGLFVDSRQRVWVGDKSGHVEVYDSARNYIGSLSPAGKLERNRETVFGSNIYCFYEDKEGCLWMGSKDKGLYIARPENNGYRIAHYTRRESDPYSLSENSIYSIKEDNKGRIWIGTYGGGLNLAEGKVPALRFIHPMNELSHYAPQQRHLNVRYLCCTSKGVMMVGTTNGLVTFSTDFERPEEIKFYFNHCEETNESSLANNDVVYLYESRAGEVYVATYSGGISRVVSDNLLSDSLRMTHLNKRNGLPSDIAYAILEGEDGNLWFSFETCICQYDPVRHTFETYDRFNLNASLFLSEVPPVMDNRQTLYIGTTRGTLYVHINRLRKSSFVPPIVFTRATTRKSDNTSLSLPMEQNALTLKKDERNMTVNFAALDYTNVENLRYAYRLKGVNNEWTYIDENHSTSFVNLPTGEFDLEVRSTNGDGVWTDNITRLTLHILPTFWETGWAWLLYVAGVLLVIVLVSGIIAYISNLKRKVDFEQQLTNLKLRFFTDISHELRTPLTLIAAPVEEVIEREKLSPHGEENMLAVKRNVDRMLRLINQLLDFRRIQNKKMNLYVEQADAVALFRHTFDNFIALANRRDIDFRFICPFEKLTVYTDTDKLEKILFNLLSNAFKYTHDGKSIRLYIEHEGSTLRFKVQDEGKGLDIRKVDILFNRFETLGEYKHGDSSGIGLSLVNELVTLLHGHISVDSSIGRGSTFTVTVPTDKETFVHDKNVEFILHDGSEEQAAPNAGPAPNDMKERTVLIVEDNAELRHFIASILHEEYQVITAQDGVEGFELMKANLPDVVVSDIMMPLRDGIELLDMTRKDHDISHIPFILLSAKTTLEDRIKGLEYGADDYITKPFSANYLKARIASLLKQRNAWKKSFTGVEPVPQGTETPDKAQPAEEPSRPAPTITRYDEEFINKVAQSVEEQLTNQDFKIEDLADTMNLSRTVFYRKIKSILGVSPKDFVRDMRIKKAVGLLNEGCYNISEIAYMSGFSSPQYFSRVFREVMNCTPSEYKAGGERQG